MVFFVCEGCNETLKKNKVDQHAARCRSCWAVSCVDCSVVFKGNDYAAHTSCISEAQKYEGSLYKEKVKGPNAKKESPQERWMRVVQSASAGGDSKLQNVLDRIAGYDNVPRKRAKFLNFMKNSIALNDQAMVERVWTLYEANDKAAVAEASASSEDVNGAAATNGAAGDDESSKKRTEREEQPEDDSTADVVKESKKKAKTGDKPIKWAKLIKSALKNAPGKQMDLPALRDQVVAQILSNKPSSKSEKELKKEFKAVVKESESVAVVEVVRLSEQ
ncbi:Myosin-like protein [Globisporangium polare]